ncbi:MAG: hypothetical protein Q9163_004675 [Psora crenata]
MSSIQTMNSGAQSESKSAKKKKAKAEAAAQSPVCPEPESSRNQAAAEPTTNGADAPYESPYIKELYKNIRNIKKKLNATQKVDSIIAENPGSTLDELLASRKINADQKAQAQKKPSLQASLTQLEEQIAQYKQFDEEYQKRLLAEKSALETSHKEELQKVKDAAVAEAVAEGKKEAKENLLALSKFLRAAAAKRQGGDETSPENRAFEGALLLVYGGEVGAVVAMESLIAGSEEKVPTVDSTPSDFTCERHMNIQLHGRRCLTSYNTDKQVRDLAFQYAPYAAEEAWVEEVAQASHTATPTVTEDPAATTATDPTVVNAGLTEIQTQPEQTTNGVFDHADCPNIPTASNIDAGAANAAGAKNWDAKISASGGDDWVKVDRDPTETDTGTDATPAAMTSTQSWAEDIPTEAPPVHAENSSHDNNAGDGFREVQHHRGGRGRGNEHRGGERRGRGGFRGDREGARGRGSFRGDRGGGDGGNRARGRGGVFRGRGARAGREP